MSVATFRQIRDPKRARINLITTDMPDANVPNEHRCAMDHIREIIGEAAARIHVVADALPYPGYDNGRFIAALDALEHAKQLACFAFRMPFHELEIKEETDVVAVSPK